MLLLVLVSTVLTVGVCSENFVLPAAFQGLWKGAPDYSTLGPFSPNTFEFAISQAPNGDYLFEDNLFYDDVMIGYQRFYVEGTGSTAGTLWYCGYLDHFSNAPELATTNSFKPKAFPSSSDLSVTFCLDSDNSMTMNPYNPFKSGCTYCDCGNWTLTYAPSSDTLQLRVIMSGLDVGSNHLWVDLTRIGSAPVITDSDVAGHGSNFSCDFNEGGRDSTPVVFPDNGKDVKIAAKPGCPFLSKQIIQPGTISPHTSTSVRSKTSSSSYDHCYVINDVSGFSLAWTLDAANSQLACSISANVVNGSWVGIGFRPLSRDFTVVANKEGTGHHMNFGMEGADIVAGSTSGDIRLLYAELYTGAPVPSDSLSISDASVTYEGGKLTLSFTRPLVGGYINSHFQNNASIVSTSADILWGVGADTADGQCDYHFNTRGLRVVDWEQPEIAMADEWKC